MHIIYIYILIYHVKRDVNAKRSMTVKVCKACSNFDVNCVVSTAEGLIRGPVKSTTVCDLRPLTFESKQ